MTPAPDTIAALATAPGRAALAVVRLSGPGGRRIVERLSPEDATPLPTRSPTLRRLVDPDGGQPLDRALVTLFPGPDSYTGEDVVEISCHGGLLAPALVLEACLAAGARQAEAGEFTRRAHLNGKLDLVQAEAVLDLVEGRSRALHDAALHQLERGLSGRISELRERLVELEAVLVHHIDFPEEDDAPVPVEEIARRAEELSGGLGRLLETAPEGELLREGALAVLAGRPNAGKSSLFNALLGRERAIVTEVPGTTRDALEAVVSLDGYPFRLVDTAGLRKSEGRVEGLGIEVARRYLEAADLVLFCAEAGRALTEEEEAFLRDGGGAPVVLVRTKADLAEGVSAASGTAAGSPGGGDPGPGPSEPAGLEGDRDAGSGVGDESEGTAGRVELSVVTGEGLAALRELLTESMYGGLLAAGGGVPLLTRKRQTRGVRRALAEVEGLARALRKGVPPEVASSHLRSAETALEEVLGVVSREEVLDRVFRDFCVGK